MSGPDELAEAEQRCRAHAYALACAGTTALMLDVLLAEYDRRGARITELEQLLEADHPRTPPLCDPSCARSGRTGCTPNVCPGVTE